jgi:hypothetical protein
MTNNKQQTAVELFAEQVRNYKTPLNMAGVEFILIHKDMINRFEQQAKEMEIAAKEMSYSDGYAQGYQRALDYISMSIENAKALISTEII